MRLFEILLTNFIFAGHEGESINFFMVEKDLMFNN